MATKIEWTEQTWNPVTGCTRVSKGCDNCYAVAMTRRLAGMELDKYAGLVGEGKGHFNGIVKCHENVLDVPLRRKIPTTYFVNSMSDLFHESVPFKFIDEVFAVMTLCPQHTFQVLTKRPKRMSEVMIKLERIMKCILPNVWLGTSCEDQETADERIPHLLKCPAAVRFLSCEPLLGPIKLQGTYCKSCGYTPASASFHMDHHLCKKPTGWINWVIVGGESGPGARPMHPDWARSIRDQCVSAGVPFFFKQWGGANKKIAGRTLDERTWDEMPEARRNDG